VRLIRASAHGCKAGINYFDLINELNLNSGSLSTNGGFWSFVTEYFFNNDQDILEDQFRSGWFATDALHAILRSGVVIPVEYQVNTDTTNVGSVLVQHRTNDSNLYLIFASMAVIGATQGRYGDPDTGTFEKNQPLTWTSTDAMTTDGCAYAASIVNMLDGLGEASEFTGPLVQSTLEQIVTAFEPAINQACDLGCRGLEEDGVTPSGDAACTEAAGVCTPCPEILRNRFSCETSTRASCAATGIIRYINNDPLGNGWQDA